MLKGTTAAHHQEVCWGLRYHLPASSLPPTLPHRPTPPRPGLPLPYEFEPLLAEVLFGQMLRLPRPQFKPIMYATLMVDLCKLRRPFPRGMSGCMRCGAVWGMGAGMCC